MALINCPNCGAKISDRAPKCPKCGYVKLSETEQPSNYEVDESISNFSEEQSTGKVWKNITVVFIILVVLCVSGFCLYHYFVNGTEQFSMTDADTTSIQSSSSTAEINTIHNDNTAGFEGLRAIHLIKHADPTQPPFVCVIIHDNWRTQILNLGFIQGGTENFVYEGDDEEASLYGSSEITLISEHFYLNIPENHIELIHKTDYDEYFEINFENKNDMEKFIESLRDFGYNESRTMEGKRCFDRIIKNEKRSTGVEWIIDGNRVYSVNSQY